MPSPSDEKSLSESISNEDLPGDENDARTPDPAPGTTPSAPPVIKDGQGPRPADEASTVGRSDAPKVAPSPPAAGTNLPDPTETGEAG